MEIEDTFLNPALTRTVRDSRHLPDGSVVDQPATMYMRSDGSYIIRNDTTGDIVQISNRNDPHWQAP